MTPITDLIRVQTQMPALPAVFQEAIYARAAELRQKAKSDNTRRAYRNDWAAFTAWTLTCGVPSLPAAPQTVETYITALSLAVTPRGAKYSPSTIGRRLCAIAYYHKQAGQADPTQAENVKTVMEGVRRDAAGRVSGAKAAVLTRHLKKGLKEPKTLKAVRDRALLLTGFAGGLRRSELVGIDIEDLAFSDSGDAVRVAIRKSKTDQTGQGQHIWLRAGGSHCPLKALRAWIEASGITTGAVFRSVDRHKNVVDRLTGDSVARIVKRLARTCGLNPADYSAHSLRAGLVTEAFRNECPIELIQAQTRHKSIDVLLRYRRDIEGEKKNVSDRLGL